MGKVYAGYYLEDTAQHRDIKWQSLGLPKDAKYINKRRVPLKDGLEKASGRAEFTRDVFLPGMLYAKMMASPYAHAKIISMNTSKAEAFPGVRYVLKYDDPELAGHASTIQSGKTHQVIDGVAHFFNQPVACAIAADSPDIVDEALKLVEITWEELPFILDENESLKPGATILNPEIKPDTNLLNDRQAVVGDVEAGFKEADQIIEFHTINDETDGASAEGGCTVARWRGIYMDMWQHTQDPHGKARAGLFAIPYANINLECPYSGAMFGGLNWMSYSAHHPWVCAVLAKRTQRPVKLLWDEMHWYGSDYAHGNATFRVGIKNDGKVTAVSIDNIQAQGGVALSFDDAEKQSTVHNWFGRGRQANISRGPQICFRDATIYAQYNTIIWQKVAAALKMDPEAVCLKNFGAEGETWDELKDWRVEMEWEFPDRNSLKECFAIAKKAIDWDNKYHAPGAKLLPNGRYHGIGVQWSHEWTCTKRPSQAALMIRTDGTVSIEGRRADIGCHIDTAICMIVADELGVKYEDVTHRIFNTSLGLEFQAPGGSTGMVANGPTVVRLARKAKAMLLDLATQGRPLGPSKTPREYTDPRPAVFPGKKPEELDCKDSVVFEKANPTNKKTVKEVVTAYWGASRTDILQEPVVVDDFTGPIDWRFAHAQQIHMTEVEVDPETGLVEVTKVVCVNDVGIAMNPDTINGQQYGGAYMGVGRSNTEEMFYDPQTGVKMNDDLIFYPIALMNDIKQVESHIVETRQGYGAYGAVGIGENIGAIMSSCTNDAVYNAIGKWVDRIVTSPDKILRTLGKI